MIEFQANKSECRVYLNGMHALTMQIPEGCEDRYEQIGEFAFRWYRKTATPVTQMRLALRAHYKPRYFLVPSVNYNGNGWGSGAQYFGYGDGETPWTYSWSRVAIPACTYTESDSVAVALFGEETGGMSCSVYPDGEDIVQELIWPEVEGPKALSKRCWLPPYSGTMEPTDHFTGIVMLMPADEPRKCVRNLLDLAWELNYREVSMEYTPERVDQLDLLFFRSLWWKQYSGLVGFCDGIHWSEDLGMFVRPHNFEIGWVGQNGAKACALLDEYLDTGDTDARDKAISVLDSWVENAFFPNGLMLPRLEYKPDHLDSKLNGDIPLVLDTCNLGTAATYFFRAADLCEKAGIDRSIYRERAFGLCDFFVRAQKESGELAKTYFLDGSVDVPHGSVAMFAVLPLFDAYLISKEQKYLDAAEKALAFYLDEFEINGYTTAGALDSNCIDKESAAPLLRATICAYEITGKKKYLDYAVDVAYYLATWQWHYSVVFPKDSLLAQLKVDTYGSTAVSAAHNALDHYGIYYIPEYVKLAELTGDIKWEQRARALWYNGTQLLSDGTRVIRGKVRPAGAQDESFRHTRWGRTDLRFFIPSEWCTGWQGTFRHLVLKELKNWDILR